MMATDTDMEPHIREGVIEMLAQNHWEPGSYILVCTVNVLDNQEGATYDWRWYWAPTVPQHHGNIP